MDAIPLGKSLTPDRSCVLLIKEKRIGIKNSTEKVNRLAINRFLAILDFQETAIAPTAVITITKLKQSKVSEILENTITLSEVPRTPFELLAYTISSKIPPNKIAAIQAYNPTIRKRNLSFISTFYQKGSYTLQCM
jgi:hypothetical protein